MASTRVVGRAPLYAAVGFLVLMPGLRAQGVAYVKGHYTKAEYQIPMRDGVRLFTAVYTPKDTAATIRSCWLAPNPASWESEHGNSLWPAYVSPPAADHFGMGAPGR